MLLKRWGANRNSGWTGLINKKEPSVSWSKKDQCIQLIVRKVNDPHGNGQYNYEIDLSPEEISKILDALAKDGLTHSLTYISEKLAPSTRSLLRLLLASGGIPFPEQSTSKA
ncbi:hypothetical protein [Metapseudomonas otitidis]|uniref:hypothetical protein n=1 Tax=Metapseudomonas otitidis TaxID=319939 RepID=UPI0020975F2B|nr:hypothetical protein [Pseudomonas otitidis]MCO7552349.1 hypothetical protein [Pseudomonas otitidis]